jgi:cellobiose phosphorylase
MAFAALGDAARAWELTAMINPVNHGGSRQGIGTYKVEPYVIAADIYALAPHTGRGGWTWYTGSAGWMYRLILESLLGLPARERQACDSSHAFPPGWMEFKLRYRFRDTLYRITVSRAPPEATRRVLSLTAFESPGGTVPLVDDRREHQVEVRVSARSREPVQSYEAVAS